MYTLDVFDKGSKLICLFRELEIEDYDRYRDNMIIEVAIDVE